MTVSSGITHIYTLVFELFGFFFSPGGEGSTTSRNTSRKPFVNTVLMGCRVGGRWAEPHTSASVLRASCWNFWRDYLLLSQTNTCLLEGNNDASDGSGGRGWLGAGCVEGGGMMGLPPLNPSPQSPTTGSESVAAFVPPGFVPALTRPARVSLAGAALSISV